MESNSNNSLKLGSEPPVFNLPDTITGRGVTLDSFSDSKVLVIMIMCNHCPYVVNIEEHLAKFTTEFIGKGVSFAGISANDIDNYPADNPSKMRSKALQLKYPFFYLYDYSQEVVKAYGAVCTPEFFVFHQNQGLTYHGRYDASSPGNDQPVDGNDLRKAIEAALTDSPPLKNQFPALGCSIKWK
ncbi:MAG: thioredoxin family protein [SAR324 cluster bacterium]|nr:thioredoxin family protein [SAR324 cluster bacterium]